MGSLTADSLALLKGTSGAGGLRLRKAGWSESTGLVQYDLQRPAQSLYPVLTPLRNKIPRVGGNGGTATNWKAITAINVNNLSPGVSEGNRAGALTTTVTSFTAPYAGIGFEDFVTFEADYAAQDFDDARARAVEGLLRSLMIAEEFLDLQGNTSLALGTTPTPTASVAAGGSFPVTSGLLVYCCALTPDGYSRATVAGGLPGQISRTNQDGTTDTFGGGNAQISAASAAVSTTSGNQTVNASIASAVKGAAAYAWYIGTSAATAVLAAITTTTSVSITAAAAGTQAANSAAVAADYSTNALVYDGFITQAVKTTGLFSDTGAAKLTSDGAGGCNEINADLKSFWDNRRLGPTAMILSSQELQNLAKLVLGNNGAPLVRFNIDASKQELISAAAGQTVGFYLNRFGSGHGPKLIPIWLHPNITPGTIAYFADTIPYPLSGVTSVIRKKCRKDYYQIEWPLVTRKYEYGVYMDGLLQVYAPFAFGVRTNILNG